MRPRPLRRTPLVALVVVLAVAAAACSSGEGDATATSEPTTTTGPTATSSAPDADAEEADVTELIAERLATELGDPEVAQQVVALLDPMILARVEQVVPADEIATTPLLSYRPEPVAGPVDALVVYAFGNRVAADGTVTPGPTNEALADAVAAFVAENPVPVYAQWEVAQLLTARGVPGVVSIEPQVGADGQQQYLSTSGVAEQAVARAQADGVELGTVGVVAHADHLVRSITTTEAAGVGSAVAVEGLVLPEAYDPESGQEWTRDRATYVTVDLSGRLATL
jgi:hypothetical protein